VRGVDAVIHHKSDPPHLQTMEEAQEQLIAAMVSEHGSIGEALSRQLSNALLDDGIIPNEYELQALVGGVPVSAEWLAENDEDPSECDEAFENTFDDEDDDQDTACPPWVRAKFPRLNLVIWNMP